jgi:hypothetical protein
MSTMDGNRVFLTLELTAPAALFTKTVGSVVAPILGSIEAEK